MHSGTKYLSGHADAMMGLLVTADPEIQRALDERRRTIGALPGTLESWLTLRGLRTLHLRVERAQDNAVELVRRLESHPAVERVRYPGFGGIVAIEVRGGAMAADLVTHGTSLWVHATSLGGVESTMERRRRWKSEPDTIPDNLIRLSVGVEDVEDLWDDLKQALDGVPTELGESRRHVGQLRSGLVARETKACSISCGVVSPRTSAATASTIGISTPLRRARSLIDSHDFTPSAT